MPNIAKRLQDIENYNLNIFNNYQYLQMEKTFQSTYNIRCQTKETFRQPIAVNRDIVNGRLGEYLYLENKKK